MLEVFSVILTKTSLPDLISTLILKRDQHHPISPSMVKINSCPAIDGDMRLCLAANKGLRASLNPFVFTAQMSRDRG